MKIDIKKRPMFEKLVYRTMDELDPTGSNTKRYKALFASMSDTKFVSFMTNMFEDDTLNFTLDVVDYQHEHTIENAERAAAVLNVPLEEYVILPHLNMDIMHPVVTKTPCLVGYHIEKRMQQTNFKKNSTSIHTAERSATTGQVVGKDKNGRSSDQENIGLTVLGATNILQELNGFRADGLARKNTAYASIARSGYCSLKEIEESAGIEDRTSLNTLNVMYMSMHIKTDLVDPDLLLKYTAKKGL